MFIKVSCYDGMVNIDSEDFLYSSIKNMYKGNVDGIGIQVNDYSEEERIVKMCNKITDIVREFEEGLKTGGNDEGAINSSIRCSGKKRKEARKAIIARYQ